MKNLRAKLSGQEGFTLVEMLIVVAIIAVLIAISIPVVSSSLEKAQHATDAANERAAKAAILIDRLSNETTFVAAGQYIYDAANGKILPTGAAYTATDAGYGKHNAHGATHKGKVIAVSIADDDTVTMKWVASNTSSDASAGAIAADADTTLCSAKSGYTH